MEDICCLGNSNQFLRVTPDIAFPRKVPPYDKRVLFRTQDGFDALPASPATIWMTEVSMDVLEFLFSVAS